MEERISSAELKRWCIGGRVPVRMTNMSFEGIVGSLQINTANNGGYQEGNLGVAEPSSYHFDHPKPRESKNEARGRKSGAGWVALSMNAMALPPDHAPFSSCWPIALSRRIWTSQDGRV